jgi:DNA-binding CsgD family transcriptional regulator
MSAGRQQVVGYGLDPFQRETVMGSMSDMEASGDPTVPFLRKASGSSFTVLRQQMVTDCEWYSSEHVQQVRRPAGTDSFIVSQCVLPEHGLHVFGIHRAWGDKPFGERERVLIQLLHRELDRQWSRSGVSGWPSLGSSFPLRLRQIFDHLCNGLSEKEIAAAMQLSQHTIHEYIKELYRRIGVRGRSELTAWLVRQMRRRPAPVW